MALEICIDEQSPSGDCIMHKTQKRNTAECLLRVLMVVKVGSEILHSELVIPTPSTKNVSNSPRAINTSDLKFTLKDRPGTTELPSIKGLA